MKRDSEWPLLSFDCWAKLQDLPDLAAAVLAVWSPWVPLQASALHAALWHCHISCAAQPRICGYQCCRPVQVSAHGPGEASSSGRGNLSRLEEGWQIRGLLQRNTEELAGVLRALNGEYIQPEAGGDLLRDGAGVLPTGAAPLVLPRFARTHMLLLQA